MLTNPWAGTAVLAAVLLVMLAGIRALQSRFGWHPELSRKAAHVGLGLATLSFPFLFDSVWPVALLGAVTVAVLAAMRWIPAVSRLSGSVVHGVQRRSGGELFFPIAAAALFVVTDGDLILFGVPVLTLALADSTAAIVGIYYGRFRYRTGEEPKSLEGSVAFFTVAFLTTHVPLLLLTDTGRVESLLIGVMFGLLVMLLEAISRRGADNLWIPFGGYLLLRTFLDKEAPELGAALVVTIVILLLVLALRRQRTLTDAAMLGAVLIGFVSWSLGGWRWVIPPLAVFLSYTLLWPRRRLVRQRPHDLVALVSVNSGLIWLLAAYWLRRPDFIYLYTTAFAANLCFFGITWYRIARPQLSALEAVGRSAAAAWLILFPAYALVATPRDDTLTMTAAAFVWIVAGGVAFTLLVPFTRGGTGAPFPWLRQSLLGLAASALGLVLLAADGAVP